MKYFLDFDAGGLLGKRGPSLGYEPVYVPLELLHWGTQTGLKKSRHGVYRVTGEQSQRDWKVVSVPRSTTSKTKALQETLLRRKDWKPPLLHLLSPGGICLGKFPVPQLRPLGWPLYRCFKLGRLAWEGILVPAPACPGLQPLKKRKSRPDIGPIRGPLGLSVTWHPQLLVLAEAKSPRGLQPTLGSGHPCNSRMVTAE